VKVCKLKKEFHSLFIWGRFFIVLNKFHGLSFRNSTLKSHHFGSTLVIMILLYFSTIFSLYVDDMIIIGVMFIKMLSGSYD